MKHRYVDYAIFGVALVLTLSVHLGFGKSDPNESKRNLDAIRIDFEAVRARVQVQTTAVSAGSITWLPHNATESRVTPGSRYEIIVVNSPTKSLGNDRKIFRMLPEWCEVINWPAEGAAPTEQAE